MQLDRIKENMGAWWDSLAEGWRHLWKSGAEAITRFKPSEGTDLPVSSKVDDASWAPNHGWSVLGGNVFEDEYRVVVQLETPGMEKKGHTDRTGRRYAGNQWREALQPRRH